MALTMLWSGKQMEAQKPLEITVRWTRTATRMGYCIAAVGDDGELQAMLPDFNEDEMCIYSTKDQARAAAESYTVRWVAQGLDVIYRDDLEN